MGYKLLFYFFILFLPLFPSFFFPLCPLSLFPCLKLVLSIKEEIITLGALTSKAFRARDPVCHLLSKRHSEIGRERESECFPGQSSVKDYY